MRRFTLIELLGVSRAKANAFTLIELLVAIAILASLLLPALRSARDGYHYVRPGNANPLFSYNLGVVRAFLDAHAESDPDVQDLGWRASA